MSFFGTGFVGIGWRYLSKAFLIYKHKTFIYIMSCYTILYHYYIISYDIIVYRVIS